MLEVGPVRDACPADPPDSPKQAPGRRQRSRRSVPRARPDPRTTRFSPLSAFSGPSEPIPTGHAFHAGYSRKRVLLPTYPFERHRHWVDAPATSLPAQPTPAAVAVPPSNTSNTNQASVPPAEVSIMATPASAAPNDTMLSELKALITDLSGTISPTPKLTPLSSSSASTRSSSPS